MKSDYVKSIGASRYDELSVKYYREGDFDKAVAYGKKAVEKAPDNFYYLYNLAIATSTMVRRAILASRQG